MAVVFNERFASWKRSIFLGRPPQKLILLIIIREVGSIVGNVMLLHIAPVTIEEHVIDLLLVVHF